MFRIIADKCVLVLNRNGLKTQFNYDPVTGMMYRRQLPEYMMYLAPNGRKIWRKSDKKILLVGGGQSNIRKWLTELGFGFEITNVDFYTDYKSTVSHIHVKEDFYDWQVLVNTYDQEWALWSLPSYALSKQEVDKFFLKSALALSPNGVLRVFPINRGPGNACLDNMEYTNKQKKQDVLNILGYLKKLGFTVSVYYPQDMKNIIERIATSSNSIDRKLFEMFSRHVSKRRQRYIKTEFDAYQAKLLDKTAVAVNVQAPCRVGIKNTANEKIFEYLQTI